MFTWDNVKNPTEVKRYAFDWSEELGASDAITSAWAQPLDGFGGGITITTDSEFSGKLSYVTVTGGTAGQTARIQGTVVINSGEQTLTEVGYLVIAEASDPATSTLQDLQADLARLRVARVEALTGTQVKEVWRDGRRIVYNVGSVADLTKAINEYQVLVDAAVAAAAGTATRPRFRGLSVSF